MFRSACAVVLWAVMTPCSPADPPVPKAFEGQIKDVRGTDGRLTLTIGKGKQAKDREFLIGSARVTGRDGEELKVGDLRLGDRIRVEMTDDGQKVQVIRVLARQKEVKE